MSSTARSLPSRVPTPDHEAGAVSPREELTLPSGWQAPAPALHSRAAYRRTDGAEVFFDRRSRPDDPLDSLSPGWNWLARRPGGTMIGHRVAGPAGVPATEGGLFLPRKFKTAGEAMRALDREVPPPPVAAPVTTAGGSVAEEIAGALARLEARGGDLLGPDGALLPRVGLDWTQVKLDGPLTLAALPAAGTAAGERGERRPPRGALADAGEASARGLPVVLIGEDDVRGLHRLAEKLVAAPGAPAAQAIREFLDFLVVHAAAGPAAEQKPVRKRIALRGATLDQAA